MRGFVNPVNAGIQEAASDGATGAVPASGFGTSFGRFGGGDEYSSVYSDD